MSIRDVDHDEACDLLGQLLDSYGALRDQGDCDRVLGAVTGVYTAMSRPPSPIGATDHFYDVQLPALTRLVDAFIRFLDPDFYLRTRPDSGG